ncbi:two-component system sensor histidine kinase NtrB [Acidithiobacillus ferrivorans]|uniref:histidine kinase n=1 Tax=Acidithiobacillus ferrivorans TaxID=160808 RepID=A0A7T4WDA9_9PROT|nr:ATP-binding protein [Acidithiobacillus ferrivorans]QQD72531.1 histidine kinase [Acidithiobacillus ferrivorans]
MPEMVGDWRRLWGISAYRLLITAVIAVLLHLPASETIIDLGGHVTLLRVLTLVAAAVSLGYLLALLLRWPVQPRRHAWIQVSTDTLLVLLLLYFGGGVSGPFSILPFLLLVSTASLLRGKSAFVFVWILLTLLVGEPLLGGMTTVHPPLGQLFIYILALVAVAVLADSLVISLERGNRLALQRDAEVVNLNALNREIVQHMDVGVFVLDRQNRVILSNPIARTLSGYRLWTSAPADLDLVQPQLASALQQPAQGDGEMVITLGGRDPTLQDGAQTLLVRNIALPRSPYRLLLLRDASALRAREREAQLAALGRLAANIAHEIRNPLSVIRHAGNLLGERVENPDSRHLFEILERETVRINAIVESVLEMARPSPAHSEPIPLANWLQVLIAQLQADPLLAPMTIVVWEIPPQLQVYADPAQLRQVFWNLLHNSAQYGVTEEDATMRVEIETVHADKETVMVTLRDFGSGVHPEVMERIFEPFFTTNSQGTGLGLSMVRELLRINGGRIDCENHPQGGVLFRIFLPCWCLEGEE